MIQTSSFFNYYKNLENHINEIGASNQISHDKIYNLIKSNFETISSLSKQNLEQAHLSFSKEGEIVLDHWSGKGLRSAFKKHIFQYSNYSDDLERDLIKFTQFVNKYFKAHISQIDEQKIQILNTMLRQTIAGLKKLEEKFEQEGLEQESRSIKESLSKLKKAGSAIEEKLKQEKPTPLQSFQNYLELLKISDLSDFDKVSLIKSKLDSIHYPPLDFSNNKIRDYSVIVNKAEKKIKKIDRQISNLLSEPSSFDPPIKTPKLIDSDILKLLEKKNEIQSNLGYINAKSFITPYENLAQIYQNNYLSIFEQQPYRMYKEFVDGLDCYKNSEDRAYLLSNLFLLTPSIEDLEVLKTKIMKIKQETGRLSSEIKRLERATLTKSGFFNESLQAIQARKKLKQESLEQRVQETSPWMIGRATANFIAAGGISVLAFLVPQASFGLIWVPKFLKAGKQEIQRIWDKQTEVDQNAIRAELKKFIKEIQENPQRALSTIAKEYKENDEQGKKVIDFVHKIMNLTQKENEELNKALEE